MRFETSQTTPPHLDRRLQRRMLSFVGLMALLMFALAWANNRGKNDQVNAPRFAASPDSLTFEVLQEEQALKDGDFIVPITDDNGPRGQSPELAWQDPSRVDPVESDREPFTSRKRERKSDPEDELFSRRNALPPHRAGRRSDEKQLETLESVSRRGRTLPPDSTPLDSNWESSSDFGSRSRREEPDNLAAPRTRVPARNLGLSEWGDDHRESFGPADANDVGFGSRSGAIGLRPVDLNFDEPTSFRGSRDNPQGNDRAYIPDTMNIDTPAVPFGPRRRDHRPGSGLPGDPGQIEVASPRIDKRYLDVVTDNTVGIRGREEAEVFYWLLDHAREVPPADFERAGKREVQYVNLMTEPDRFRGEPITIEGDLWRLYEFESKRNNYDLRRLYEGWVFTGDSSNHPYRVVFTSLPRGIEPGENLRTPVRITGYFFKLEGYRSQGGVTVAPTLLAQRIAINLSPNGIPSTAAIVPYMIAVIMAVGLALLVTIAAFAVSDQRSSRAGWRSWRLQPKVSFAGLVIPEAVSVEESLRSLAEHERQMGVSGAYGPLLTRQVQQEHAVHDYSASRRLAMDEVDRRQRDQVGILQTWTARQHAAQAEIDGLRTPNQPRARDSEVISDELNSNHFDPARNVLPKRSFVQDSTSSATFRSHASEHSASGEMPPLSLDSTTHRAAVPVIAPIGNSSATMFGHSQSTEGTLASHIGAAYIPTVPASDISYRASKLSEWEEEIASMNRRGSRSVAQASATTSTVSVAAQLEHDRLVREQEIRTRISRQHAESERLRSEQHEREQRDRQRAEYERLTHEQHERDRIARERIAFDRTDRDSATFTLADSTSTMSDSNHLVRERLERERLEHERLDRERIERERNHHDRLEQDRIERERNQHDRLEQDRLERERNQHDRLEYERTERERILRERLEHERIERERIRTHREYDVSHNSAAAVNDSDVRDVVDSSLTEAEPEPETGTVKKRRGGGWGWPRRRKTADSTETQSEVHSEDIDPPISDEVIDDVLPSDDAPNGDDVSRKTSGWGRQRKRGRNLRDSTGE